MLDKIIDSKEQYLKENQDYYNGLKFEFCTTSDDFKKSLQTNNLAIIGEVKRKSPSKGHLAVIDDPMILVNQYVKAGINAISVLTDRDYFSGTIADLQTVARNLEKTKIPVLRKDFIIDEKQIIEAAINGASAVLLIVAVLGEKTAIFVELAKQYGMDALVEVHNKEEIDIALNADAEIIGINNRNLKNFNTTIDNSLNLVEYIPDGIVKVSESGIKTAEDMKRLYDAGFNAVLIAESLVTHENPAEKVAELRSLL